MTAHKTALVLSAGGMFGAYQAGVWKALEKTPRPDLIVGASVGALNGWLIAAGCSGEELARRWLDPAAGNVLTLASRPNLRNGWFEAASLRAHTEKLFDEAQPEIPFGLVTLRLPSMRAVLVQHPGVSAAHLQASCSIPLLLPAVSIAGYRYVDGGFLEKLPLWAAVEMGATRIVAVDSLPRATAWWLRAGIGTVRALAPARHLPPDVDCTVIEPSEPLGAPRDAVFWKRENIARWIALGERDAASQARERQIA